MSESEKGRTHLRGFQEPRLPSLDMELTASVGADHCLSSI
jgi:hypothetical protein